MMREDGELLARLAVVNQSMGEVALRLLNTMQVSVDFDPDELRTVGQGLVRIAGEMTKLGVDMTQRADALSSED